MPDRCPWAAAHPLLTAYHDREWGVPLHDDTRLLEFLILEGAQAGLSWLTVLQRRDAYRLAFDGWNAERIARWGEADIARRLQNPGIIRNRLKIRAAVANAQAFLRVCEDCGSFHRYIWEFVGGSPEIHRLTQPSDVPALTSQSRAMSRALESRGFRFAGPTICYAFMQACGMVMDHLTGCFRYRQLGGRFDT